MTKSFQQLLEIAADVSLCLAASSYSVHHYDDGSYVEFRVDNIVNLSTLVALTKDLRMRLFAERDMILVRLYENYSE